MDHLPVELISMIAAQLQQWNLADQPFSHLTEISADNRDGWLIHTKASRRDIKNFRLVCSKLCHSTLCNFGEILGDRVYRFTKVGLEVLQAMSNIVELQPHIRTLTF
jgi:hypothetical protein